MVDPTSGRSNHSTTLRNKFDLEKHRLSYTNYHCEDVKKRLNMAASPSNHTRKPPVGYKDEIVRHMSNLPSYLETGRTTPDRALSFGVMDWGRLEKWQYQHVKCSPSTSNSSPLSSSDGSTSHSTRGQRGSPAGHKPHRVTLQSHFNMPSFSGNVDKFQDVKDARFYNCTDKKTAPESHKMYDSYPGKLQEYESSIDTGDNQTKVVSLKGKMKIQETSYKTCDLDQTESHKKVFLSPTDSNETGETNGNDSVGVNRRFSEKRSSFSSKISAFNTGTLAASKLRSMSPIRRFSFSSKKGAESPVLRKSTTDGNTCVSNRSHSSPLRRLLEPLFPLKATNSHQYTENPHEDSKLKANSNLDLRNCGEVISDDNLCRNETTQALFKTAIKNGRPLFTFAVENNSSILAATVRNLSSAKDNTNHWIYSFFTIDEIKKKNRSWLISPSRKDKDHGNVPKITAQMTVSNRIVFKSETREFSLFRTDQSQVDELAAIVVKFSRNLDDADEELQDRFNMTVILPGGNHGKSSHGIPSPLIERWRSSGVCDCGGWDLGCRLRTLTNQVQSSRISDSPSGQFVLSFQGDVIDERRFFRLCPLKEGIYSVEYNSSLSPLQALSICISVMECRKSSQHTVAKQVNGDPNPVRFASFPPLSPVGRV